MLGQFGLARCPGSTIRASLYSLIVADVWQWTPFMFSIMLAGMMALPIEVVEAASIDGASPAQTLWHVELPMLRPVLLVAILLRLINSISISTWSW